MKVEYIIVNEHETYPADAEELETTWDDLESADWMAEDAAKDHHENHDGFESDWPLTFEIFCDGKTAGRFEVELEFDPIFSATEVDGE